MKVNIFAYDDYRPALKAQLLQKKAQYGRLFTYDRLAKSCRVQKSYLSRALGGHAHLSDDQIFTAADFLGLGEDERNYLLLLHTYQRSGHVRRRTQLAADIATARARSERSESVIEARAPSADALRDAEYHLDPNAVLVHMFMTVAHFRQDPKLIATALGLSPEGLALTLEKLSRLGMLTLGPSGYLVATANTHVPVDSPFYRAHSILQRTKTLERIMREVRDDSYHFSVVFSADDAVRRAVKDRFLLLLKDLQPDVAAAPAEQVFQLNFDLFRW